jgi:hypothetical protein
LEFWSFHTTSASCAVLFDASALSADVSTIDQDAMLEKLGDGKTFLTAFKTAAVTNGYSGNLEAISVLGFNGNTANGNTASGTGELQTPITIGSIIGIAVGGFFGLVIIVYSIVNFSSLSAWMSSMCSESRANKTVAVPQIEMITVEQ